MGNSILLPENAKKVPPSRDILLKFPSEAELFRASVFLNANHIELSAMDPSSCLLWISDTPQAQQFINITDCAGIEHIALKDQASKGEYYVERKGITFYQLNEVRKQYEEMGYEVKSQSPITELGSKRLFF
jgi:hypothetical protein